MDQPLANLNVSSETNDSTEQDEKNSLSEIDPDDSRKRKQNFDSLEAQCDDLAREECEKYDNMNATG